MGLLALGHSSAGCGNQRARQDPARSGPCDRLKLTGQVPATLMVGATPFKGKNTIKAVTVLAEYLREKLKLPVSAVIASE